MVLELPLDDLVLQQGLPLSHADVLMSIALKPTAAPADLEMDEERAGESEARAGESEARAGESEARSEVKVTGHGGSGSVRIARQERGQGAGGGHALGGGGGGSGERRQQDKHSWQNEASLKEPDDSHLHKRSFKDLCKEGEREGEREEQGVMSFPPLHAAFHRVAATQVAGLAGGGTLVVAAGRAGLLVSLLLP